MIISEESMERTGTSFMAFISGRSLATGGLLTALLLILIMPSMLRAQENEIVDGEELQRHVIDLLWIARDGFTEYRGAQIEFTEGYQSEYGNRPYYPSIWKYESSFPIGNENSVIQRNRSIEGATIDFGFNGHYTYNVQIAGKPEIVLRYDGTTLRDSLTYAIEAILPEGWSRKKYDYPYQDTIVHWKECEGDRQGHMVRLNFANDPNELTVGTYDAPCPGSLNLPPKTVEADDPDAAGGQRDLSDPTVNEGAIQKAVRDGEVDEVTGLLLAGADINVRHDDGCSLLHHALQYGPLEMPQLLLKNGADIEARNEHGSSPLLAAVQYQDDPAYTRLLLDRGADIHSTCVDGDTALHILAMFKDNPAVARLLLDAGADINARNNSGETALDIANEKGHLKLADMLIANGADR